MVLQGQSGGGMSVTVCNRRVRSAASIGDCLPRGWGNSSDEEGSGPEGEQRDAGVSAASRARSFDSTPSKDMPRIPDKAAVGHGGEAGISEDSHVGCVQSIPAMAMGQVWRSCESVSQSVRSMSSAMTADGGGENTNEVHLAFEDGSPRDLAPDVPLIYCSCISVALLMYFIVFVDCRDMARALNPELHTWHGLDTLNTGFSVGASILLGFFVWLLHALLYDVAGMITGVLPAFVTFATTFSYRLYTPRSGELVLAACAIACGLLLARSLDTWQRRPGGGAAGRKEITYGDAVSSHGVYSSEGGKGWGSGACLPHAGSGGVAMVR